MSRAAKARLLKVNLWLNAGLLLGVLVAWPLTQLTIARHEPPFVLSLSWFAIAYAAWNTLLTALVAHEQATP
jgi:hypothetical protein